jgi:hypothetical protein
VRPNRISGTICILAILGLVLLAAPRPAHADDPTFPDRLKFGSGRDPIQATAFGDMNGDGSLDLVVGNDGAQSLVYLNDGSGHYDDGTLASCDALPENVRCFGGPDDSTTGLAVADMNHDGYLDIVAGLQGGQSRIYLNDGKSLFANSVPFGPARGNALGLVVGDVNGDAAPDIVAGGEAHGVVYLNDGKGGFFTGPVDSCAVPQPGFRCVGGGRIDAVALADVNGDGKLDIAAGSNLSVENGTQSAVYLNSGAGGFAPTASSACAQPENADTMRCFGSNDAAAVGRVAAADLNGDGRPDIAVAYRDGANAVYLNSGGGTFSPDNTFAAQALEVRNTASEVLAGLAGMSNTAPAAGAERSLTLADVNADGSLDIVAGTMMQGGTVYLNDRAGRFALTRAVPFGAATEAITAVAAGDVDSDGDLDLAVGNDNQRSGIYLNDGAGSFPPGRPFGSGKARAVAVGDLNDDGRLDVIAAEINAGVKVYLSNGMGGMEPGRQVGEGRPLSIAVADVDGNGSLDLIVGYGDRPAAVYLNDGRANFTGEPRRFGLPNLSTLATGDMDGTGSLDIIAGYAGGPAGSQNYVYLNDGQGTFDWQGSARKIEGDGYHTRSVAVGDLNGDGALDVVFGNYGYPVIGGSYSFTRGEPNFVYLNDGTGNFDRPGSKRSLPGDPANTTSVALGDVNGDGSLDIVVANAGSEGWQDFIYLNDGGGRFPLSRSLGSGKGTPDLVLADMNGDGALDVVAAHLLAPSAVYINDGTGNFPAARTFTEGRGGATAVAAGDMNGDGLPDIVTGGSNQDSVITLNRSRSAPATPDALRLAAVIRPDGAPDAGHYTSPVILQDQRIPVTYTLYGPARAAVGRVEMTYSPDGGGHWLPAAPTTDTVKSALVAAPFPSTTLTNTHVYTWDTFASGFFDQSDNVVLRLRAYPGSGMAPDSVPDAQQWPHAAAVTSPVRVRGTQIRVFKESTAITNTVAGAYVFRLPADQISGGRLLANQAYQAYRTDGRGYLQGASKVEPGDRLIALWPKTSTYTYTLYYTSAPPTPLGLDAYEVKGPGTQELVVSEANPLVLFNLDVSLEWDARNDGTFLADLAEALKRASETFYHVSGGQMALGQVRIFQNKENWLDSDVLIYANSSVRPRATMGGVVNAPTSDVISATKVITDAFLPGQIRMGPAWDPYGENRAELTRDWQRALAHEFGHYLLYLPDNYLGYDKNGVIKTIDCRGSFMTNSYDDEYARYLTGVEFRKPDNNCADTIAARLTGRSDWETITKYYPKMVKPVAGDQPGPAVLPLDITEVSVIPPTAAATALPARYFDLRSAATGQRINVAQGQGYLHQTQGTPDLRDDRVIPLGSTGRADRLRVRGASPGDRVCVYDDRQDPPHWGCESSVGALSSTLRLKAVTDWAPNIIVEPRALPAGSVAITRTAASATGAAPTLAAESAAALPLPVQTVTETVPVFAPALAITVTLPQPAPPGQLNIQVLPAYEPSGADTRMRAPWVSVRALDARNPITYTQVISLESRIATGFVRVWISVGNRVIRESLSQFYLDPSWGQKSLSGLWGDSRVGLGGDARVGLGGDSRVGLGGDSRVGLGGDSRVGLGGDSRVGLGGDSRVGLGGDSRVGLGGDSRVGLGGDQRAWGANHRAAEAPIASSDGQVTIYNREDALADTATGTLQSLGAIPTVPDWLTPVGQAYRFGATQPLPRTIGFNYLQREVPPGYEHTLQLYYSTDEGKSWSRLPTELDTDENLATAPADDSGLYMLAASIDIPFYTAGWNLFAYPVPEERPVEEALRSIAGDYSTVFTYDNRDAADPWKVFDASAPGWVNDLKMLEYGHGYWVNISVPTALQIRVAPDSGGERPALSVAAPTLSDALGRRNPPGVYYGTIEEAASQTPASGQTITAEIDGQPCGVGTVLPALDGMGTDKLRYVVKVVAAELGTARTCGLPGKDVRFKLNGQALYPTVPWDNRRPTEQTLKTQP